jgi:nucleoside-diphosphate kinase
MHKGNITLTMIKPAAVRAHHIGDILAHIEHAGFRIIALKMTQMPKEKAEIFYEVHKDKPFFDKLVTFMKSGPVVVAMLKKENAVADFRRLIGSTDPAEAETGTIRKLFARDKTHNAIHGSDSDKNAIREVDFFFSALEQFSDYY